jgi:hypothetical protein
MDKYITIGKKFIIYIGIIELLRISIICICANHIYYNFNINIMKNSDITNGICIFLFTFIIIIVVERIIDYHIFISPDLFVTVLDVVKYHAFFLTIVYFLMFVSMSLKFLTLIKNSNNEIILLTNLLIILFIIHIIYLFSFCCKKKYKRNLSITR